MRTGDFQTTPRFGGFISGSDFHQGRPPSDRRSWRLTHIINLCAISDIYILSELAHNVAMNDLARDPRQIGNLIRRARKRQALSQKALGDKAGLRQETISLIENGNSAARIETLLAVLAALDLEFQIAPRSKPDKGGYV